MRLDRSMPLNMYKIKSSHNSYSTGIASRNAKVSVTEKILKYNFSAIELDIVEKSNNDLVVSHIPLDIGGILPFEWFLEVLVGDAPPAKEFFNLIVARQKSSGNPLIVSFDFKGKKVVQKTIDLFLELMFDKHFPKSLTKERISECFVLPSEINWDKNKKSFNWPSLSKCRNKILLCIHKEYISDIQNMNIIDSFKYEDLIHVDNNGYFSNIPYDEDLDFEEFKKRIIDEVEMGIIVRIYPPFDNTLHLKKGKSDKFRLALLNEHREAFTNDSRIKEEVVEELEINELIQVLLEMHKQDKPKKKDQMFIVVEESGVLVEPISSNIALNANAAFLSIERTFDARELKPRYRWDEKTFPYNKLIETSAQMIAVDNSHRTELSTHFGTDMGLVIEYKRINQSDL